MPKTSVSAAGAADSSETTGVLPPTPNSDSVVLPAWVLSSNATTSSPRYRSRQLAVLAVCGFVCPSVSITMRFVITDTKWQYVLCSGGAGGWQPHWLSSNQMHRTAPLRHRLVTEVSGIDGARRAHSDEVPLTCISIRELLMSSNSVKQKLGRGEISLGTFVFEFNTSGIARLAAEAGAEFVIFDMEHTGWSVETIRSLIASTPRERIAPLVRVPAKDYHFLARVLDMGSLGIMVPMVETRDEAQRLVDCIKYPPRGRRGAAFTIAHDDYTGGDVAEKMRSANDEMLLIAQIETATGLANVNEIAGVDGIDVLWIGQFDLSASLGIPGQFEHPKFLEALQQVVAAANQHAKAAGFMVLNVDEARTRIEQGFRCISYNGDLWIYQAALQQAITAVRSS